MLERFCRVSESFCARIFLNYQLPTPGLCAQNSVKTKETSKSPACPDNSPRCCILEASPVVGSAGHKHACVAYYMLDGDLMSEILFLPSKFTHFGNCIGKTLIFCIISGNTMCLFPNLLEFLVCVGGKVM